ncbi:hypothetical protein ACJX0J_041969, partial [Zea mays]
SDSAVSSSLALGFPSSSCFLLAVVGIFPCPSPPPAPSRSELLFPWPAPCSVFLVHTRLTLFSSRQHHRHLPARSKLDLVVVPCVIKKSQELGIWMSFGTSQRATADRPWLEATMACSTQVLSTTFNGTNKIRAYAHCAKNSVRRSGTCDGKLLLTVRCLNHARFNMFSGRDRSAPNQPGRHQHEPHLRDKPRHARPERKEEGERDVRRPHHP